MEKSLALVRDALSSGMISLIESVVMLLNVSGESETRCWRAIAGRVFRVMFLIIVVSMKNKVG